MPQTESRDPRQALFETAMQAHQSGNFSRAVQFYRQLLQLDGEHGAIWHLCGVACYQSGALVEAEQAVNRAIELQPDDADFHSNLGNILKALGRYSEAAQAYMQATTLGPGHLDAFFNLGSLLLQEGKSERAMAAFQSVLALEPGHVNSLVNCGHILSSQSRHREAVVAYRAACTAAPAQKKPRMLLTGAARRAGDAALFEETWRTMAADAACAPLLADLASDLKQEGDTETAIDILAAVTERSPGFAPAWNNLGACRQVLGEINTALQCYNQAIALQPNLAAAHTNLGILLVRLRRIDNAITAFRHSLSVEPANADTHHYLVSVLIAEGRMDDARQALGVWRNILPGDAIAEHLEAACSEGETPDRASDRYVRAEFDSFAERFDDTMGGLEYRAPKLLEQALSELASPTDLQVLDAGCGTGLCAPLLRNRARRLVGVDLSTNMLRLAHERACYDELIEAELTRYLENRLECFDLIVAVDTLNYFGRLDRLFGAVRRNIRTAAHFIFTIESMEATSEGFRLNGHGRYSHCQGYVANQLVDSGFRVIHCTPGALRQEADKPVAGIVITARSV